MKNLLVFFAIISLLNFVLKGQSATESYDVIIDGPANIRSFPNEEVIISLNDGQTTHCNSFQDGWFELDDLRYLIKQSEIRNGNPTDQTSLYDFKGNPVGKWILFIKNITYLNPYNNDYLELIIDGGATHKNNVILKELPEFRIQKVLDLEKRREEDLALKNINWDEKKTFGKIFYYSNAGLVLKDFPEGTYTYYMLRSFSNGDYTGARLILLFEKGELILLGSKATNLIEWEIEGFSKIENSITLEKHKYWINNNKSNDKEMLSRMTNSFIFPN